jgi:guanylate kinase
MILTRGRTAVCTLRSIRRCMASTTLLTAARQQRCVSAVTTTVVSSRNVSTESAPQQHDTQPPPTTPPTAPSPIILDPLVVCGPSGVGKGTVITRFLEVQQLQYDDALKENEREPKKEAEKPVFLEFVFAISHTTRSPRPKEINGVHYHFVTIQKMKQLIGSTTTAVTTTDSTCITQTSCSNDSNSRNTQSSNPSSNTETIHTETNSNESLLDSTTASATATATESYFVEHATVHGNMYGTSWDAIMNVHRSNTAKATINTKVIRKAILDIDIQGVKGLKQIEQNQAQLIARGIAVPYLLQPKYVFIAPPNLQSLQERLGARGTESKLSLQVRTNNAIQEMNYGLEMLRYALDAELDCMYRKSNNFHTVLVNGTSVNDTVDHFMIDIDRLYRTTTLPEWDRPERIKATNYEEDDDDHMFNV